ncbi:MAG: hypothetical protein OXC06_14665 [Acidimicrobiaceae bacterium]|nr:hypothetical protein [Acidimicrobiaceae bacterium]
MPGRLLTGAPPVGWHHNSDLGRPGMQFELAALGGNALMALLLLAAIGWIAVVASRTSQEPESNGSAADAPLGSVWAQRC